MNLVSRFLNDLEALNDLIEDHKSPIVLVQSKHIYFLRYGFGDSLGGGSGLSLDGSKFVLETHVGTSNEQGSNKL